MQELDYELGDYHAHHWSQEKNFTGSRGRVSCLPLPGIPRGKSEWLLFLWEGQWREVSEIHLHNEVNTAKGWQVTRTRRGPR